MVPEHCLSSVLTVSVRGSIGTLNFKTIFSFLLTLIALSLGSIETSFGVISEVFFGFSTTTFAVPPHPPNNTFIREPTNTTEQVIFVVKFNLLILFYICENHNIYLVPTMRFYSKHVNV